MNKQQARQTNIFRTVTIFIYCQ